MKKVIITGSESFVARELIKQCLASNIEVTGIDMVVPTAPGYNFVQGDIRDKNLASKLPKGADTIIHLAALSRDQDCKGKALACFDINVLGTLNMVSTAKSIGAKQFIFASSEWVYESFKPGEEKDETTLIDISKHTSEYALSKLVSEANLRQEHAASGLPITIFRFAIIYGPRKTNWSAVESLASKVKRGEPIKVGSLKNGRRFIHVSDVASGIIAGIGLSGFEVINLSGDKLITLGDIITTSEKIFSVKANVEETAKNEVSVRNPSNKKAGKLLGWRPEIELETGIKSLADFL